MSEEPINKQLRRIKNAIINHLRNADYDVIKSDNDTLCVIGARDVEWRCIKGHIRNIPRKEVAKLERLPCPGGKLIKKELWLRDSGEIQFYKIFWNDDRKAWIDQFGDKINFQ